jgi:hypothetical protein
MLFQIKLYLKFLWHSKNEHVPPFVFTLITKCFYDSQNQIPALKDYRKALLENKKTQLRSLILALV